MSGMWYGPGVTNEPKKERSGKVGARELLSRGGQVLGLAALAHAEGHRPGKGDWHVLSPALRAAANQVIAYLEQDPDPGVLETVINAAMSPEPATRAPAWAETLIDNPDNIERVGSLIDVQALAPALGDRVPEPSSRQKCLAALALGLCRSPDRLAAVAERLPDGDGTHVLRMGCLAGALVESGRPTEMRARLKAIVKEQASHG
jgi:hypothetical protein